MTTKFKPMACGWHAHTDIGSGDGGSTIESKVNRAVELGRPADCVTDHGYLSALAMHHFYCSKKKIMSIHGIEAYIINFLDPTVINKKGLTVPNYNHITVHFVTQKAYEYFCKLTPVMEERSVVKYGDRKPLMTWSELEGIADDIVLGSSCFNGPIQSYVVHGDLVKAKIMYEKMRSIVRKDRYYIEIMPHLLVESWIPPVKDTKGTVITPGFYKPNECVDGVPIDLQAAPNRFLINMARKYGDRLVFSEDGHISKKEEKIQQDVRISDGSKESWKFSTSYSMESSDFWAEKLKAQVDITDKEIEEMVDNSYHFIEHFKDYKFHTFNDGWKLPKIETVFCNQYEGRTNVNILHEFVQETGRFPKKDHPRYKEYKDRYFREIELFHRNGKIDLLPYFFICYDVANWCRKNNILISLRGSGSGALLSYLLGLSVADAIAWDLPVERCLTTQRIFENTLPDLDLDFSEKSRVLEYISNKYKDKTAPVSINISIKFKAAVRDIERLELGSVRPDTELMCRNLPDIPNGIDSLKWLNGYIDKETEVFIPGFLENDCEESEVLREYERNNPILWKKISKVCGINRQRGKHACAVVIADNDLKNHTPIMWTKNKTFMTAFCPKSIEYSGYVKFDFLGVTTLEALNISINSIKETTGIDLGWEEFPATEQDYEDIIGKCLLAGLFQIKTKTMKPYVQKIQPRNSRDISNIIAMVRPQMLKAPSPNPNFKGTAADYYVAIRQGKEKPYYIHPDLEQILAESYGLCLFQENTIKIFNVFAKYDLGKSETIRKGIAKKVKVLLEEGLRDLRIELEKANWTDEQIKTLCKTIIASAGYGFNKSHSAAYAVVCNNGIYLKKHYPLHYYLGELTVNTGEKEKLDPIVEECSHLILPADVKFSHANKWIIEGDKLRAPLNICKGVGNRTPVDLHQLLTLGVDSFKVKSNEHLDDKEDEKEENNDE